MNSSHLDSLRNQIKELDKSLVELLDKRFELALQVGKAKEQEKSSRFYAPEQEQQVARRILSYSQDKFPKEALEIIFRHIVSSCLAAQKPLKIGCLGPEGTFSSLMAQKLFSDSSSYSFTKNFKEIFKRMSLKLDDYALVPIENSTEGVVGNVIDQFYACDPETIIVNEAYLPVQHCLIAKKQMDLNHISHVYSHPQPLGQCQNWLHRHLPQAEQMNSESTASAYRHLEAHENAAFIGHFDSAMRYKAEVLRENIQDEFGNTTRFFVLGRQPTPPTGRDKTACIISGNNRPGLLAKILMPFEQAGIDLSCLQSRPHKEQGRWTYFFYIEAIVHRDDSQFQTIVQELKQVGVSSKILGSYPY